MAGERQKAIDLIVDEVTERLQKHVIVQKVQEFLAPMVLRAKSEAWQEGFAAASTGLSSVDNPYREVR